MLIGRVATLLTERRRAVAVVLVLITLALASGLPRLKFETSQDTLVNRDSTVAKQNRRYQALFGGNADIASQGKAAADIERIVQRHPLAHFDEVAAGTPTLLAEINDYLQRGMATLGAFAVLAMIVLLFLVFRTRWRLLSLGVVAVGCVWAFGAA